MWRTRTLNCLMVLGAIVSSANLSARAADWTGNGLNTLWSTPANWAENAVPDVDLTAIVDELSVNDYSIASDKRGAWIRRMGGLVIIVNFDNQKGRSNT